VRGFVHRWSRSRNATPSRSDVW